MRVPAERPDEYDTKNFHGSPDDSAGSSGVRAGEGRLDAELGEFEEREEGSVAGAAGGSISVEDGAAIGATGGHAGGAGSGEAGFGYGEPGSGFGVRAGIARDGTVPAAAFGGSEGSAAAFAAGAEKSASGPGQGEATDSGGSGGERQPAGRVKRRTGASQSAGGSGPGRGGRREGRFDSQRRRRPRADSATAAGARYRGEEWTGAAGIGDFGGRTRTGEPVPTILRAESEKTADHAGENGGGFGSAGAGRAARRAGSPNGRGEIQYSGAGGAFEIGAGRRRRERRGRGFERARGDRGADRSSFRAAGADEEGGGRSAEPGEPGQTDRCAKGFVGELRGLAGAGDGEAGCGTAADFSGSDHHPGNRHDRAVLQYVDGKTARALADG